eukprot:1148315-Pelagomonas_calceolata.AAC.2
MHGTQIIARAHALERSWRCMHTKGKDVRRRRESMGRRWLPDIQTGERGWRCMHSKGKGLRGSRCLSWRVASKATCLPELNSTQELFRWIRKSPWVDQTGASSAVGFVLDCLRCCD